jgi:hypothetical protein
MKCRRGWMAMSSLRTVFGSLFERKTAEQRIFAW